MEATASSPSSASQWGQGHARSRSGLGGGGGGGGGGHELSGLAALGGGYAATRDAALGGGAGAGDGAAADEAKKRRERDEAPNAIAASLGLLTLGLAASPGDEAPADGPAGRALARFCGGLSVATLKHVLLVALWTLVYYATSAAAGVWNKWLVDKHTGGAHAGVAPTTLTLLHLAIGLASDSSIRACTRDGAQAAVLAGDHRRSAWDLVQAFLPISVFVTLGKVTTYLSYQYVSMALAHTAKASEPIFNVVVAALFFGEFHSRQVYLSLVPISLGIFLASVSDFTYNHTGFAIAVSSALAKVLQNIYTKRLMDTGRYTFWVRGPPRRAPSARRLRGSGSRARVCERARLTTPAPAPFPSLSRSRSPPSPPARHRRCTSSAAPPRWPSWRPCSTCST